MRVLPRLARMVASLVRDREVPLAAKLFLGAAAVYLASPIDLIPDFLPVVGIVDDLLLAAIVVDGVLNHVDRRLVLRPTGRAIPSRWKRWGRWRAVRLVPSQIKARIFGGLRRTTVG